MSDKGKLHACCTKIAFHAFCLIFITGCLTPIDFEVESEGGLVVVSGQISPLPERNIVQVGITAHTARMPFPYSGANVWLYEDDVVVSVYDEDPLKAGNYVSSYSGTPGKTYFVRVTLTTGEVYESARETMPAPIGKDTVYHKFVTEQLVDREGTVLTVSNLNVYADSELPATEGPLYLKWSTEEAYILVPTDFPDPFGAIPPNCYIVQTVEPQKIVLHNGAEIKTQSIPGQLMVSRPLDKSFYTRHYFTTYQSSLTPDAFEYWRKVNIVANQVGSIFDSPPAEVLGNMFNVADADEKVTGYFQAANMTYTRFYLVSDDMPFEFPVYCEYSPFKAYEDYPNECIDCLIVRNSSYERPAWF